MDVRLLAAYPALRSQLSGGRGLSHAYLISGPDAGARDELARLLAAAMLCTGTGDKPCGTCSACKKVKASIHPDLITVDIPPDKKEILVEQARWMRTDAWIRPNEGERKVYMIRNAQSMRIEGQNAILKLLEEGPAYAAFLLLADNPEALLPTIRSRCEGLSLAPPPDSPAEDGQARAAALEMLSLMTKGNELALCTWTAGLEKWDREAMAGLLRQGVTLLRDALALSVGQPGGEGPSSAFGQRSARLSAGCPAEVRAAAQLSPRKLLAAVDLLEKLRADAGFNVGTAHLCGALCAGLSGIFF